MEDKASVLNLKFKPEQCRRPKERRLATGEIRS